MKNQQMEIGFDGANRNQRYQGQRRRSRAKWWFSQMRMAVDAVTGNRPAGTPPPTQIYLSLTQ